MRLNLKSRSHTNIQNIWENHKTPLRSLGPELKKNTPSLITIGGFVTLSAAPALTSDL